MTHKCSRRNDRVAISSWYVVTKCEVEREDRKRTGAGPIPAVFPIYKCDPKMHSQKYGYAWLATLSLSAAAEEASTSDLRGGAKSALAAWLTSDRWLPICAPPHSSPAPAVSCVCVVVDVLLWHGFWSSFLEKFNSK